MRKERNCLLHTTGQVYLGLVGAMKKDCIQQAISLLLFPKGSAIHLTHYGEHSSPTLSMGPSSRQHLRPILSQDTVVFKRIGASSKLEPPPPCTGQDSIQIIP
mmetsp:Transcript_21300/g.52485  ORF Transcript_21300/g.52485 Transcript_21300/m.52485 type:complete len:103 (+) Transcript_21300:923-1231(+)